MMLGGLTESILMLSLGLGYIVCYLAKREEKELKTLGYLIGVFMIALSALLIISNIIFSAKVCNAMRGGMGMGKMGMMHRQMMPQPVQPPVQK